jgi:hypothetical protein
MNRALYLFAIALNVFVILMILARGVSLDNIDRLLVPAAMIGLLILMELKDKRKDVK